jgi:TRAP-type C4-dicarboxylate transport system permease small subunit
MREKLRPWIAAMFCATLAVIVIITNLCLAFVNGTPTNSVDFVYYCFLPMCFIFVGDFLSALRKENLDLRTQVDELSSQLTAKTIAT